MKIYFVMNIYEKLNLCDMLNICFCLYQWKQGTDFIFQKNNFENFLQRIVIFLSFLQKIHAKPKNPREGFKGSSIKQKQRSGR